MRTGFDQKPELVNRYQNVWRELPLSQFQSREDDYHEAVDKLRMHAGSLQKHPDPTHHNGAALKDKIEDAVGRSPFMSYLNTTGTEKAEVHAHRPHDAIMRNYTAKSSTSTGACSIGSIWPIPPRP